MKIGLMFRQFIAKFLKISEASVLIYAPGIETEWIICCVIQLNKELMQIIMLNTLV